MLIFVGYLLGEESILNLLNLPENTYFLLFGFSGFSAVLFVSEAASSDTDPYSPTPDTEPFTHSTDAYAYFSAEVSVRTDIYVTAQYVY